MTIRTYALYGCSKRLLTFMVIVLVSLVIGVSASTFGHFSGDVATVPGVGCYESSTAESATRIGLAWMAEFVFELLIFILTVYRVCKTRGLLQLSLFTRRNMIDIIFYDGVMYFGAMALVNIPNILAYYSGPVATRGTLATLSSCISVTLISRLVLNLHKSTDASTFSIPAQDDDPGRDVLTTRVNVQSAISSHHC
ncbi:hypothetical protein DEU56DRAFT_983631 [Suillus clintonianus]|uniref:uncharacterized protein n=1 Tax=Suillus clintonianus TaxID=1904413 RepID=UPI001B85EE29|nr:uncharacterized protein DEU56DRAFT_983631 [Suillus clintonianus]KAG2124176.1 hypothetical protein DEU56DRAFT_983631 [Suillus clintonianus]